MLKWNDKPANDGVTFHGGVVEVNGRFVVLQSFKSSVQGIRARVKFESGTATLRTRVGEDGWYTAYYLANGWVGSSVHVRTKGRIVKTNTPDIRGSRMPTDGFESIGFAATGRRFVFEFYGEPRWGLVENRIKFGSPAFGGGHAFFKDIEVFVPDKDEPVVTEAAKGPAIQEKAGPAKV